jgi:rhamnosyltransferase subunit B
MVGNKNNMNIIIVGIGSWGDMNPLLGIGAVLKKKSHSITVLANSYFEKAVKQAGLDFYSIGRADEYIEMIGKTGDSDMRRAACDYLYIRPMKPVYDYCAAHYIQGDTVVVCSISSLGARLAHEKFGMPMVSINLAPMMFISAYDPPLFSINPYPRWIPRWVYRFAFNAGFAIFDHDICPQLNTLRKEIGLPPQRKVLRWMLSPQKIIGLFPGWFAKSQPDWPPQAELTGFPLFEGGDMKDSPLPADLEKFLADGDAPIIVTPGTTNYKYSSFFVKAVEAITKLGVRAIFISRFKGQIPANLPSSIRFYDYLSFSQVLHRASALIHHGGIGTMAEAFHAGIPQLIVPWGIDQFDNGARVKALGVGDVISSRKCTAKSLEEKLAYLLYRPEVRERCKEISDKMRASDPIHDTCRIIEYVGTSSSKL